MKTIYTSFITQKCTIQPSIFEDKGWLDNQTKVIKIPLLFTQLDLSALCTSTYSCLRITLPCGVGTFVGN